MLLPPTKLSDAIEMALEDLRSCERDPHYIIDMGEWHKTDGMVCHVCLAGAMMDRRFRLQPSEERRPSDFGVAWTDVFLALDSVRDYCFTHAIQCFGNCNFEVETRLRIEVTFNYYNRKNPEPFYESMNKAIKILREYDL